VDALEELLQTLTGKRDRDYRIASGGGRMKVTMDRYEADWGMVERGWKIHVRGEGRRFASARAAIETLREENPGTIDQDLPPFVIGDAAPAGPVQDGDAVVFFNFRGDRALEITAAFENDEFSHFDRGDRPDVLYAGMMEYDGDYHIPKRYLVEPPAIERTMGEYLAREGITQFACSETQKYGHVTYFWNGNRGGMFDEKVERYLEIPSDNVSFDQRPWMKAAEITDATIQAIASGEHRLLRINYANGDMVGHTGDLEATITAVQAVDLSLARLLHAVAKAEGVALVTADHGNADEMYMWDKKKQAFKRSADGFEARTSHSLNPVPFFLFDGTGKKDLGLRNDLEAPGIANVAATVLELLGFEAPEGYLPSLNLSSARAPASR
jgi:2,3-bisphosphoglycerate-independent phosphoglycerate mutase